MPALPPHSSQPDSNLSHSWRSNPLDWPHIDRMILLAFLILVSPFLITIGVGLMYWLLPTNLNLQVALGYVCYLLGYSLALIAFMLVAWRKRNNAPHWEMMEIFIIYSYAVMVFVSTWLTGTTFTLGLLLFILGISIASPLASIRHIKLAYLLILPIFLMLLIVISLDVFPFSPLFSVSPYHPDGSPKSYWLFLQAWVVFITLSVLYIALITTDRWNRRENDYREMSSVDSLTQLSNRRTFMESCQVELQRLGRSEGAHIACIMLDIDHFKQINDRYGHQAGDVVLVKIAGLLAKGARRYDEVGRYGGEEFVMLLPNATLNTAMGIAERLREQLAATPIVVEGTTLEVTASFGVASEPAAQTAHFDSLIKAADTALYRAKQAGRNRVMQ